MFWLGSSLWSARIFAHCPASYHAESACFMLEQNTIYIYDKSVEHNGPYKDLKSAMIFSDSGKQKLSVKRVARGIFKLESKLPLSSVTISLGAGHKVTDVTVKAEK